jgi:hypothetical protein
MCRDTCANPQRSRPVYRRRSTGHWGPNDRRPRRVCDTEMIESAKVIEIVHHAIEATPRKPGVP